SHPGSVSCSGWTGAGLDGLLETIAEQLRAADRTVNLVVPYDRGDIVAGLHRAGEVIEQHDGGNGLTIRARLDDAARRRFAPFVVNNVVGQTSGAKEGEQ
ncbi:MAG TPA: hypothetical protein VNE21_06355, partial [Mycobacteriales bacterium]|nr:hypothetical protein [Mycobacteriales bacterium]